VALAQTMRMIITYTPFRPRRQAPGAAAPEHVGHVKLWPQGVQRNEGHEMDEVSTGTSRLRASGIAQTVGRFPYST